MKQIWLDIPRWVRGFFLGNIAYILYAVVIMFFLFRVPQNVSGLYWIMIPILLPAISEPFRSHMYLYHLIWCVLAAVLVQWLGEKRGLLLLVCGLYVINVAAIIFIFVQFSRSE